MDAAERGLPAASDAPYEPSVGRPASILTNLPAVIAVARVDLARLRGDPTREGALARQAADLVTEHDQLLGSLVRYQFACADSMTGRLDEAERALTDVVAERPAPVSSTSRCAPAMTSVRCRRLAARWMRRHPAIGTVWPRSRGVEQDLPGGEPGNGHGGSPRVGQVLRLVHEVARVGGRQFGVPAAGGQAAQRQPGRCRTCGFTWRSPACRR